VPTKEYNRIKVLKNKILRKTAVPAISHYSIINECNQDSPL
jgi:hypothetical protein